MRVGLTILSQSPSLVTQEVLYPTELFRECTRPNDRFRDLWVVHDLIRVDRFTHVEVDSQTEQGMLFVSSRGV